MARAHLARTWKPGRVVELARQIGSLRRGPGDPTWAESGDGSVWRASRTPQLSTAVMMARSGKKGNAVSLSGTGGMSSVTGGSYPARIWTSFMSGALSGQPVAQFTEPEDLPGGWGVYASPSASPSKSASKSPSSPSPTPSGTGPRS